MNLLHHIFQTHGPQYIHEYGERMPRNHLHVLQALMDCRSGRSGHHLYACDACQHTHLLPSACGNRHCPGCQQQKAQVWLERQEERLLPCPYFLITFTVPQELRRFLRSHQKDGYGALFSSSANALKKLALDERFVGANQIGFFGVLHTWGRQLEYHPHIHYVVPGGGLSADRQKWCSSRADLFVHVRPLSRIYRAKFKDAMRDAGLLGQIDPEVWEKEWVVDSRAVGNGRQALRYLARYVFRVAISHHRIVSVKNGQVTFRYRDSASRKMRTLKLAALEFLRRFLQHVLPVRFMKVRHFGFLGARAAVALDTIREMICVLHDVLRNLLQPPELDEVEPAGPPCPHCRRPMRHLQYVPVFNSSA